MQRPLNTSEMPYKGYTTDLLGHREFVLATQNALLLAKDQVAKLRRIFAPRGCRAGLGFAKNPGGECFRGASTFQHFSQNI